MKLDQCQGKEKYLTWGHAQKYAKWARKNKRMKISPYKCKYCGLFHTGNDKYLQRQ